MEDRAIPFLSPASARRIARHVANLGSNDEGVAQKAEACLIRYYGVRALEPLIGAARDEQPTVRFRAAIILGCTKDRGAFQPLLTLLYDRDGRVRYDACMALGILGDPRAVAPLINKMSQEDPEHCVDSAAAMALQRLGAIAVRPLITQLRSPDSRLKIAIASVLGAIGDPAALDSLDAMREDPVPEVRAAAAEAVEEIGVQVAPVPDSAEHV